MMTATEFKNEEGAPPPPSCAGCGSIIICATDDIEPFAVFVRDPFGSLFEGGQFCGACMVELAKHGLRVTP